MKWMDGDESIIEGRNGVSSMEAAGTAYAQVDPALITGKQHSSREHAPSCPVARHWVPTNRREHVPGL